MNVLLITGAKKLIVDRVMLLVLFVIQVSKSILVLSIVNYTTENITSNCRHGDIRLMGGKNNREGIVEICINNLWGRVCTSGWNTGVANVTCRHAGFSSQGTLFTLRL